MSQPVRGRSSAPTIDRLMAVSLLVAVTVIATYVALLAGGDKVLPPPMNALIFAVVSTAVLVVAAKKLANDLGQAIERIDAKVARIHNAVVRQGATLAETTGEIPRLHPTSPGPRDDEELDGYAKGYADGLARKPIPGKLLPFDTKRPGL